MWTTLRRDPALTLPLFSLKSRTFRALPSVLPADFRAGQGAPTRVCLKVRGRRRNAARAKRRKMTSGACLTARSSPQLLVAVHLAVGHAEELANVAAVPGIVDHTDADVAADHA